MIRNDKQITDNDLLNNILSNNTICRIALTNGEKPYLIPMNYGYKDQTFYLHTATKGTKLDLLKKNNNVCIEVTDSIELIRAEKACGFSTKYRSVICTGKAYPLTSIQQKIEGLKIIMMQHTGKFEWEIPEAAVSNVVILKIVVEAITGKAS